MATSEPQGMPGQEFHHKLRQSLDTVCRDVGQIVHDVRKDKHGLTNYIDVVLRVDQAAAACEESMDDVKTLIQSMEQQIATLHEEMQQLEGREQLLTQERDDLLARGHELYWRGNCRQLERNLAESFVSRENCLSVDSARSFRDEAGEKLCRTSDLLRVGEIRSSGLDNDIHSATKDLSQSLEKWRQSRSEWVETLDNLLILQTDRIREWLKGTLTDEQRQLGERTLEYLQLAQQERHLSVQALQSALGMRTFNTSLEFDHNTNQMQFQQLDELQGKMHVMLHEHGVYLHAAPASTDLVRDLLQDELGHVMLHEPSSAPAATMYEQEYDLCHDGGKSLHRCSKVINLSEGHDAEVSTVNAESGSWTAVEEGESKHSGTAVSDSRIHRRSDNDNTDYGEDSLYDEDDDEVLMGAVSSMESGRALNQLTRARSSGPLRRRRTSELLAKGDTDSKLDVVPTVRSNTNQTSPLATRDPFLVRLRRRFSFTPRSESLTHTNTAVSDDVKLRPSDSEPSHSQ